ncbi:MAG TPA: nitroreductase/quinone reductase family protein [Pseudonocardiaceae bacterium]|nr:nitroreductase/quinone reductase family protein [Pseudonocardiaceae bacterium]
MKFDAVNPSVIEQFRDGREVIEGVPGVTRSDHILLTTIGARSGERRTVPLRVFRAEHDRLIVVAGNGGEPTHPGWYHNILANPRVIVENSHETYDATGTVLSGAERERLWTLFNEEQPGLSRYLAGANRVVAVVALDRN